MPEGVPELMPHGTAAGQMGAVRASSRASETDSSLDQGLSDSEDVEDEAEEQEEHDTFYANTGCANLTAPLPPPVPVSLLSLSERNAVTAADKGCHGYGNDTARPDTMRLSARLSPQAGAGRLGAILMLRATASLLTRLRALHRL